MTQTPENAFWQLIHRNMKSKWHASRHEDYMTAGVPDVSFGLNNKCGWIELKVSYITKREKKTPVHITTLQKHWLFQRGQKGGNCWVFIRIRGNDIPDVFCLVKWDNVGELDKYIKFVDLVKISSGYWEKKVNWDEFYILLSNG